MLTPPSLGDAALYAATFALTLSSFWVYYDGLDRLSNLEAYVWAGAILLVGLFAAVLRSAPAAAFVLVACALYVGRTRV